MKIKEPGLFIVALVVLIFKGAEAGNLTGTIRDSAGTPVAGALVRLCAAGTAVRTDSQGVFSFSGSTRTTPFTVSGKEHEMYVEHGILHMLPFTRAGIIRAELLRFDGRELLHREYLVPEGSRQVVLFGQGETSYVLQQMHILRILADNHIYQSVSSPLGAILQLRKQRPGTPVSLPQYAAVRVLADTLVVSHIRYITGRQIVTGNEGRMDITLAHAEVPYRNLYDTRQTASYTPTAGEDADVLSTPPFYVKIGNEAVRDTISGLWWQQAETPELTFDSASRYCAGLTLAGRSDWRLPSSHELFSITVYDRFNPALDTSYFHSAGAEYWWSSDAGIEKPNTIWVVNAGGGIGAHAISESRSAGGTRIICARCVAGDPVPAELVHDFSDQGDSTILDKTTGLVWQQSEPGVMNWEQALVYADTLNLAGHNDWRVPNVRELRSINDDRLSRPSLDKTYFPRAAALPYWSSTTQMHGPLTAWHVDFRSGLASYTDKASRINVRCVRGGVN